MQQNFRYSVLLGPHKKLNVKNEERYSQHGCYNEQNAYDRSQMNVVNEET
jgi:hypothetical protein